MSGIVEQAKQAAGALAQGVMQKAVALAPDSWISGGTPDPLIREQHGQIGRAFSRIDGPVKVAGQAPFAAEFPIDGMLYAAIAFSTIAKGRIASLDTAEAEAAPGVALVMTHRNAPRMQPVPMFGAGPKAAGGDDIPIMQDADIHWNGQPIAVVLADTQEAADHAASLIAASYERADAVTGFAAAKAKGTNPGVFMGQILKNEIGDAEAALASAAHRVDARYATPRHNHNAIELHALTVKWEDDTHLRIHDASQLVAHTAWSLGQVFGLEEDAVHVTSPFVGGGFGGKTW